MNKLTRPHLFCICPTDCLEPVIDKCYKQRNYYYTSLGNSLVLNADTRDYLRDLILKYGIEEISLILSDNNPIVRDSIATNGCSKIPGLDNLYSEIVGLKEYSSILRQENNDLFALLSRYLNKKMQEFRLYLNDLHLVQIEIHGKIYNRKEKMFHTIYPDLVCRDYFSLN